MVFLSRVPRIAFLCAVLALAACEEKTSTQSGTTTGTRTPTPTQTPVGSATPTSTSGNYRIEGRLWTNAASTIRLADGRGNTTDVTVTSPNGSSFAFPMAPNGASYRVTVAAAHPLFRCEVYRGSGTISSANVTDVAVLCLINQGSTPPGGGAGLVVVGGTVSGLTGTLGLANARGDGSIDSVTVTTNGFGYFPRPQPYGSSYNVYVTSQPAGQTCTVASGQGVAYGMVSNVTISCVTSTPSRYSVGGTISGLSSGQSVKIRNNGIDEITLSSNGSFTFATTLASGTYYNVTIQQQPSGQTCTVLNGAGMIYSFNVNNVWVNCTTNPAFTLAGTFRFQDPPAVNGTGGAQGTYPHLAYESAVSKPGRRLTVWAVNGNDIVAEGRTNDLGQFSLNIPAGNQVRLLFLAEADSGKGGTAPYSPDGVGGSDTDYCNGARYLFRSMDNTNDYTTWSVISGTYSATNTAIALQANVTHNGNEYTNRAGIPFNAIEVALQAQELMCSVQSNISAGELDFLISERNRNSSDFDLEEGRIRGTRFLVFDDGTTAIPLPGQQDEDTDELDDGVIAHEIGHFFNYYSYRSDSLGGTHSDFDVLDTTVAFSEGFANAFSGITLKQPVIVNTYGDDQQDGDTYSVAIRPGDRSNVAANNDRGFYSENSMGYLVWMLFERRDGIVNSGDYSRIHATMKAISASVGQMNGLTFGATYISRYGRAAETFETLWATDLDTPVDALCEGSCLVANPVPDFFDRDMDAGSRWGSSSSAIASRRLYPHPRVYPSQSGSLKDARFWTPYRALDVVANVATTTFLSSPHEAIDYGNYGYPWNKYGANRYYAFKAPQTRSYRISITNPVGGTCTQNTIDLYATLRGVDVAFDESTTGSRAGCPFVQFSATAGETFVLSVSGFTVLTPLQGWNVVVEAL